MQPMNLQYNAMPQQFNNIMRPPVYGAQMPMMGGYQSLIPPMQQQQQQANSGSMFMHQQTAMANPFQQQQQPQQQQQMKLNPNNPFGSMM